MQAIGFQRGRFADESRPHWSGEGARPMVWTAWYPAKADGLTPRPQRVKFFQEALRFDRAPIVGDGLPLVVLSHGTGGAAEGLSWLAEPLAAQGYIVIGIDHHGNTASEPYLAEGFLAWWERARDITLLLDHHLSLGPFAQHIDSDRIYGAGFSMGGYTLLANLGGRSEVARYRQWALGSRFELGPKEFPVLHLRFEEVFAQSAALQASWARQAEDYRDPRIKAVLALAPAPMVRAFTPESIASITAPVTLVVGGADYEAPAALCADWIAPQLCNARLEHIDPKAAHYVFMPQCTPLGAERVPHLCQDAEGLDRAELHQRAVSLALETFR